MVKPIFFKWEHGELVGRLKNLRIWLEENFVGNGAVAG
jgi:hypothetical protein